MTENRAGPPRVGAIPPQHVVDKGWPDPDDEPEDRPGYNPFLVEGY